MMTRTALSLLAVAALAGCELYTDRFNQRIGRVTEPSLPPPPPPRLAVPSFVVLDDTSIIVGMDDGAQCLGSAGGSFTSAGWTGILAECPYAYTYQVALAAGTLPTQQQLNPVIDDGVPPPEDAIPFRPLAVVTVTDLNGQRFRFETVEGF